MPFLIIDIKGEQLTAEDVEILRHKYIAGVLLFSRNVASVHQLNELIQALFAARPDLLIAIDHEGGNVQRLQRQTFRSLPAARVYGDIYDINPESACQLAFQYGKQAAADLLASGIHLSLSPVLDLHVEGNPIIAGLDRAFHRDPQVTTKLAKAYILGMKEQGMPAVGKHFPGHGATLADSHTDHVVCHRTLAELQAFELYPFTQLMALNLLDAVMPAHVIYPAVDPKHAAGYSKIWLQQITKDITIISDCLGMEGADIGDLYTRAQTALDAGCDLLIIANQTRAILRNLLSKEFNVSLASRAKSQHFINKCINNPTLSIPNKHIPPQPVIKGKSSQYNNTQSV